MQQKEFARALTITLVPLDLLFSTRVRAKACHPAATTPMGVVLSDHSK